MSGKPRFPLPLGHVFGPSRLHLTHHDGRGRIDALSLRTWQQAYRSRWNRPRALDVTGVFDAGTQRAVLEVQRHYGMTPTGLLDQRTWDALWDREPPGPQPKPAKPPKPEKSRGEVEKARKRRNQYWERFSRYKIGTDPDAPTWWPGRPFGVRERGPHVEHVQRMLGFAPTGRMQTKLGTRLRGLQRAHDLLETGLVDVDTAWLLERLYGETEEGAAPDSNDGQAA